MSDARTLVVEFLSTATSKVLTAKHPGCRHAVHDGALSAVHREAGEIGGYADGVWLRWWYEPQVLS